MGREKSLIKYRVGKKSGVRVSGNLGVLKVEKFGSWGLENFSD